jgi:membrane protease YdiL (CAAX protease family)
MNIKGLIQRHPVVAYFGLVYLLSYGGFFVVVGPKLLQGKAMQSTDAFLLFPVIVVGVCLVGIALTGITDGRRGLRDLFSRMGRWRVDARWYATLLIPPGLILAVLLSLRTLVSPVFAPNMFLLGIVFGLFPGFFEEVGWMGFAFPRMHAKRSALGAGLLLGVLWGLWHAPVVDYLGAAAPHGVYWLPFFLAFIAIMTAMRVLIVWVYSNTHSVLLAQLMHASSTGFLVILGPAHVSPGQEALWYAVYAAVLWMVVALVIARYGKGLVRHPKQVKTMQTALT